jgi:drug/metabolite transporter (DMT)-like permease
MPSTTAAPVALQQRGFDATDWALFLAISGIWGSSFLLIDIGLDALHPGAITLVRVGLGALTLAAIPGARDRLATSPRERIGMVALSALWVGVPFTLFPLAGQRINSATSGLLNGATPIFTAIFAALLYRLRPTRLVGAGLALGFVGVALISAPSLREGSSEALGVAMVVVATCCYGIATNVASPLIRRFGPVAVMSRMLMYATAWTAPYGIYGITGSALDPGPTAAVVTLGIVGTGVAYWIMATLVGRVGATRASFITYLIPVVSLVLGVVFRGDEVAAIALVGVALVIAGAALAGRSRR